MNMKKFSFLAACCLIITSLAFAQPKQGRTRPTGIQNAPTTCPDDPVLSSDGTVTSEDYIAVASVAYYTLNVKAGHSYSIEVWDPFDPTASISPSIGVLASDCATSVPVTDVTNVDPDLSGGFASRVSWIQGSNATVQIAVTNTDQNNGYIYYIRVTDTTLFNLRWSTYSGFNTQWGLTNTTSVDIAGTLTIINSDGTVLKTDQKTFKAGQATFLNAQDEGIPANHVGSVVFTYVGPPGGILADAYFLSPDAKTIVPTLFEGKHSYH
jgi:hypothetical protein